MNTLALAIILPTLASSQLEPFTFVQSPTTRLHIALHTQPDHHRVHFLIRIRGLAGKEAFARVRVSYEDSRGNQVETQVSTDFSVVTNNDLWSLHFRVPRFAQRDATYQIEIGEKDPSRLDIYEVRTTFAWKVQRDRQGRAHIVREENGVAVSMFIPVRRAQIVGERIEIVMEVGFPPEPSVPLQFATTTRGAIPHLDGAAMAEKVN